MYGVVQSINTDASALGPYSISNPRNDIHILSEQGCQIGQSWGKKNSARGTSTSPLIEKWATRQSGKHARKSIYFIPQRRAIICHLVSSEITNGLYESSLCRRGGATAIGLPPMDTFYWPMMVMAIVDGRPKLGDFLDGQ